MQRGHAFDFPLKDVKKLARHFVVALERKIAKMSVIRDPVAALAERWRVDRRPERTIPDELDAGAR